ncbi:MAG TPA: GGDEF domain-containing protein, partial [Roseiflexaceae bacterium]|nr:GGDEF domain-containing protein [Roseiflexaceae bacterium]
MPRTTRAYILFILAAGIVVALLSLHTTVFPISQWLTFAVLAALATFTHVFAVEPPGYVTYHASPVFVYAGVLLLDPALYTALVFIYLGIDWAKQRLQKTQRLNDWYVQPYNIAVDLLAGMVAHSVYASVGSLPFDWHGLVPVLVGILAAISFLVVNQTLTGILLVLARRQRWSDTGMLTVESSSSELIFLLLGYVVAVLWQINPWLMLPALSPIVLMYRALRVPVLQEEAQTDPKTRLLNARYLERRFREEFARAVRFNRPLSYIMADIDFLRDINNTYGHLAGDQVLTEIGTIIASMIREYDVAGRFGGEEFCIIMLESGPDEAAVMAERIRATIEEASIKVDNHAEPIRATM